LTEQNKTAENIFINGWRPYVWIAILVMLAYGWSVNYGFTYLDDDALVLRNEQGLKNISGIGKSFAGENIGENALFYRPVLMTSFILNYRISKMSPWGYHLINIVLHLFSCLLLFELLKRILASVKGALIGCLLFAVHPVNVQAVAWIPGRNDTLLAIFLISSFVLFIDYFNNGGSFKYFLGLLFFSLGLLVKESAVVYLLVVIGYFLLVKKSGLKNRQLVAYITGMALLIIAWYWYRTLELGSSPEWQRNRFISLTEFLFMILTYLGKTFLPLRLSPVAIPEWPGIITGVAVLAALLWLILYGGIENRRIFWFGLLWAAAFSLPYFARGSFVTIFLEHRFYHPFMGLLIAFSQVRIFRMPLKSRWFPPAFTLILLLGLGKTISYGTVFKDRQSFWACAEKTSAGSSLVLYNIGLIHQEKGQYDLAAEKYLAALKLNPDYAGVHNNLAIVYQATGKYSEAENEYRQAIKYNPHFAKAHDNLGGLYYVQGKVDQAKREFSSAIEISDLPAAHNNLGGIYYSQGFYREAGQEFAKAVELDPYLVSARVNLGSYFLKSGSSGKAESEYLTAIKLDPGNAEALYNLSLIYIDAEKFKQAEEVLLAGIKANPGEKMLYFQLSSVCFLVSNFASSIKYYDDFLELGGVPDKEILSRLKKHRTDK
jgi:tetratricopeptide (TPR) repeat protein